MLPDSSRDHLLRWSTQLAEPDWDSRFLFEVHLAGCILYAIALILNTYLIYITIRFKPLPAILNWAVGNQLFSNAVRCIFQGIYCAVKANQFSPPNFNPEKSMFFRTKLECTISTGMNIMVGFGPLWSLSLFAFAIAVYYSPLKGFKAWFTPFRFMEARVATFLIDLVVIGFLTNSVMKSTAYFDTYCTWQLMVRYGGPGKSNPYFYKYHLFMVICVCAFGIAAVISRAVYLRQKRKARGPDFKHSRQALLIRLCCIVFGGGGMAALFIIARVAFLSGGFRFWLGSETLTYPIMFILMPFILVTSSVRLRCASLHRTVQRTATISPADPLPLAVVEIPTVCAEVKDKIEMVVVEKKSDNNTNNEEQRSQA